jgi:hypothetical protein
MKSSSRVHASPDHHTSLTVYIALPMCYLYTTTRFAEHYKSMYLWGIEPKPISL